MKKAAIKLFLSFVITILMSINFAGSANAQGHYYNAQHQNGIHQGGQGYCFATDLADTTFTGTFIVDTSLVIPQYYLDTNDDNIGDMYVMLGPWWYVSAEMTRPVNGETLTITGKFNVNTPDISVLIAETINNTLWRDLSLGLNGSGRFVNRNTNDSTFVYCGNDSLSYVGFGPGSMGFGGMWSDSIFIDMNLLPGGLMPASNNHLLNGYHFEYINSNGGDMLYGNWGGMGHGGMGQGGMGGGKMNFENNVVHRFYYDQALCDSLGISEPKLMLNYWDEQNLIWVPVNTNLSKNGANETVSAVHNMEKNYFELSSSEVFSYVGLFSPAIPTSVLEENELSLPNDFVLLESYPNPFNPELNIKFKLARTEKVDISIYNVIGQLVSKISTDSYTAGSHTIKWNGKDLHGNKVGTGIYLVRLKTATHSLVTKVTLIK